MKHRISRRHLLSGGAALTVTTFDPQGRTFYSRAAAADCPTGHIDLPGLRGTLSTDPSVRGAAAEDFGMIVSRNPRAVLRPGSVGDIARVLRFARQHRVKVAVRGISHSVFGQAQADCGIVIDSSSLNAIHAIDPSGAWVDAGVKWSELLNATLAQGLAPKVFTDYIQLTTGGVLSVGGIGGASNRHGFVSDNVSQIECVDGLGRRRVASSRRNRRLFDAVRGGLGQVAVVTKAKIDLEPAPGFARIYDLVYTDLSHYLADQRRVSNDDRFDFLEGQIIPDGAGGWNYLLQAGAWYTSPSAPDDAVLLSELRFSDSTITDLPTPRGWRGSTSSSKPSAPRGFGVFPSRGRIYSFRIGRSKRISAMSLRALPPRTSGSDSCSCTRFRKPQPDRRRSPCPEDASFGPSISCVFLPRATPS